MKKISCFLGKYWIYIAAFCVPWFVIIMNAVFFKGWPIGDRSILNGDTSAQLVPYAFEIWDKVHNGGGFNYTWNMAGGIDFSSIMCYYFSPFTLLILLSARNHIIDVVQIVMILKWSCAAVSIVYFFNHTKYNTIKYNKKAVSFFLGIAFILSSSQINFVRYIQFTDITICFPILLLLVEQMVKDEKWMLYSIILAFSIISNTYMAFEVCLFLIIWFVFQLNWEVKNKLRKFVIFACSSTISAVISAAPIINGLTISSTRLDNTANEERLSYAGRMLISLSDFVRQLFIFAPIHLPSKPDPNIYLSVFGLILLCFFPVIIVSKKRKIFMLTWIGVMVISFFFGFISLFWHLFTPPNGVFHRFSNLFVFTALFLLMYVLIHLEDITIKHICIVGAICLVTFCYTFFNIDNYDSPYVYLSTIVLAVLYFMLMILFCKKSITYKNMLTVIVIFGTLELLANTVVLFNEQYNTSHFSENDSSITACIDMAERADVDMGERIASSSGLVNTGLIVSKPSISGFTSSINGKMHALLSALGMGVNGKVLYTTRGASPLINLMFNIRYIVGRSDIEISDAEIVAENEICRLYRTDRLAGLGYMVNEDIALWNPYNENTFDNQNSFASLCLGKDGRVFTIINPNIICTDINNEELERDEDYIEDEAFVYYFKSVYGNENDSIQAEFTADEDMDLYAEVRTTFNGKVSVFIDGEMISIDDAGHYESTYHVGNVKKGQKVSFVTVVTSDYYKGVDTAAYFRFAKFDENTYKEVYEELSKNSYDIEVMDSDYIKGTITADEKGLMMTSVQSQIGFDVYVDGEKSGYYEVGGALIAVPLEKGKHVVEFRYVGISPKYGKLLSIIGIIAYIIFALYFRQRYNRPIRQEQV